MPTTDSMLTLIKTSRQRAQLVLLNGTAAVSAIFSEASVADAYPHMCTRSTTGKSHASRVQTGWQAAFGAAAPRTA